MSLPWCKSCVYVSISWVLSFWHQKRRVKERNRGNSQMEQNCPVLDDVKNFFSKLTSRLNIDFNWLFNFSSISWPAVRVSLCHILTSLPSKTNLALPYAYCSPWHVLKVLEEREREVHLWIFVVFIVDNSPKTHSVTLGLKYTFSYKGKEREREREREQKKRTEKEKELSLDTDRCSWTLLRFIALYDHCFHFAAGKWLSERSPKLHNGKLQRVKMSFIQLKPHICFQC